METVGRLARLGGHLEASGFLLDRIRRRARPRNRQARKSLCQAGHEESVLDIRATGSGYFDNEIGHVTAGASSTAMRGIARPSSQEQCHYQEARVICRRAATLTPIACDPPTTGRTAPSTAAISSGWIALAKTAPGRSQNDQQSSGKPRHPLRQRSEKIAFPVGARTTPFDDLAERATAAGAASKSPGSRQRTLKVAVTQFHHRSFRNSDPGATPVTRNRSLARVQAT